MVSQMFCNGHSLTIKVHITGWLLFSTGWLLHILVESLVQMGKMCAVVESTSNCKGNRKWKNNAVSTDRI